MLSGVPGRAGTRQAPGQARGASGSIYGANAVHPMQAMLNFRGVLAARMRRVIAAHGLDPAFGFLHDGKKPGRLSLVWDCVELHRPKLVTAVFGFAARWVQRSFRLIDEGIVRLAPAIMKEVAAVTIGAIPLKDMIRTVEWGCKTN